MQILSNGQVQITNSETGETKIVHPMELGSINPILANQYYAYMTQQKALDKASAGNGTTDVLKPPDNSVIPGGNGNQNVPQQFGDGNALMNKTVKKNPPKPTYTVPNLVGNGGSADVMGAQLTPMTTPIQYQQPQPQKPLPSSTFDISKAGF